MIVFEINGQCESLLDLLFSFIKDDKVVLDSEILINSIIEWSIEGYEKYNLNKIEEYEKKYQLYFLDITKLLKLHCDWKMVKYEYDNQVIAKAEI